MPLSYSAPLIVSCAILHWLVSQSIFIIQTTAYESGTETNRMPKKDTSRAGFSIPGIILALIGAGLVAIAVLANSYFRKYRNVPKGFPQMATDSAAISAICHPPSQDTDAHLLSVKLLIVSDASENCVECSGRLALTTPVDALELKEGLHCVQPVIIQRETKLRSWSNLRLKMHVMRAFQRPLFSESRKTAE
ncbi:hypothetical protein F5Y19DRAFT_492400 [Xylariaceae sp. FL1651]|nr:hypothetical protein F5Y19DRAFT_492400 [Xylariaceae sp. FL1651]